MASEGVGLLLVRPIPGYSSRTLRVATFFFPAFAGADRERPYGHRVQSTTCRAPSVCRDSVFLVEGHVSRNCVLVFPWRGFPA